MKNQFTEICYFHIRDVMETLGNWMKPSRLNLITLLPDNTYKLDEIVKDISDALKELHAEKMSKDKAFISNNGDKNLDIYYDALSWQGLRSEHEIIWEVIPETRKKALNEALSEFDVASTKNCN